MKSTYKLVVISGPMEGEEFDLPLDRPIKIGRGSRGADLYLDDQVSLEHAQIEWVADQFWVKDLGSHGGTFVDGKRVGEKGQRIKVGSTLEVGKTILHVVDTRSKAGWIGVLLAILTPVALAVGFVVYIATRPIQYDPIVVAPAPIRQGPRTTALLTVPKEFIRAHGIDHRSIQIRRITDFDGNGLDEVWFLGGGRQYAITFTRDGHWRLLGDLPPVCDERTGVDFPQLICNGAYYVYENEQYIPDGMKGVVAWLHPLVPGLTKTRGGEYAPNLRPYMVTLLHEQTLAGFLAERGVHERIHYLICEEVVTGLRAQVLTESGQIRALDRGCLSDMELSGAGWAEEFGTEIPRAIAFTEVGRRAFLDDVAVYLTGGTGQMFVDWRASTILAAFGGAPANRLGIRVGFTGAALANDVIPPEIPVLGTHVLERGGVNESSPIPNAVFTLPSDDPMLLDPPGCSQLEVVPGTWHCRANRFCLPSSTFLSVRQIGCGENRSIAEGTYRGGVFLGRDGHVDVEIHIDSAGGLGQIDVLRARVGYRTTETDDGAPAP